MAIINSKEDDSEYLSKWQSEFRKHFNSVRVFNSCRANYRQRIELLESLKSIDQELEPVLRQVVEAFQVDWEIRSQRSAAILADCFQDILSYRKAVPCTPEREEDKRRELHSEYLAYVSEREREAQQAIRRLFKHNISYNFV